MSEPHIKQKRYQRRSAVAYRFESCPDYYSSLNYIMKYFGRGFDPLHLHNKKQINGGVFGFDRI